MDLSIIIVNWNTRDLLDRCLEATFSTVRSPAEVIVVDNGSEDGSPAMVARKYPQCILLRNPDNRGFARANNQGLRIARGHYILLLNSDTRPLEGCLDGLVDFLQAHPDYGAAVPRLLNEDGSTQHLCYRFPTFTTLCMEHTSLRYRRRGQELLNHLHMEDWDHASDRDVDQPAAACFLMRAKVARRIGLFDEGCFLLYNDVDLCKRIRQEGIRIAFVSNLRLIHSGGASLNRFEGLAGERLRNVVHFVRKHYGPLAAWVFKGFLLVDALRLGQRERIRTLMGA